MPLPITPHHDREEVEEVTHLEATETAALQEEMRKEEESLQLFMNRNTAPITKPASRPSLARPPLL